ncbi:MAG TPA: T9SS type A sorting domain-containing protein [bacterium]|nr:T9SS type A sorting domain-containing protein [bacterium]
MSMRRIARIPAGPYGVADGRVLCGDFNHDSLPDMYFFYTPSACHETWEFQGWNRFKLVFEDTNATRPHGVNMRCAIPFAAGDIDGDGLTDVVCITVEYDSSNPNIEYDDVITVESPDSVSYPSRLSWYYRCGNNFAIPFLTDYLPDMDGDGHKGIFSATPGIGTCIWENTGNDQNQLVWRDTTHAFSCMTVGDFDMDGKMKFASASAASNGVVSVRECTPDDQYQVVYQDTVGQPNGDDAFMTKDIDGDGLPEFYIAFENVPRGKIYLCMWQANQVGSDVYHRTLVDSLYFGGTDWGRISECGDIDGDGIDECIWTTPAQINVYKAVYGNKRGRPVQPLQEVWHWNSDHGSMQSLVSTVYDVNNDGYKELITAGNGKISIFEVDAVDLKSPTHGSYKVGDTVPIRWTTHSPPRCDSLSLFLRRGITPSPLPPPQGGGNRREGELGDSVWLLDTIATGLPGTDTLYRWVVPSGVPDSGRIVVMAYGPGHQWDMSDSVITFIGGGVAEGSQKVPLRWSLSVSPNPARGAFSVRYEVPSSLTLALSQREREGVRVMSLGIYDVDGRLVRSLSDGQASPGRHEVRIPSNVLPAGVYFCTMTVENKRFSKKVVLTE